MASTDFVFVLRSGDRIVFAEAKDNLATSDTLGDGVSTGLPSPALSVPIALLLVTFRLVVGVLPRLGNNVAQPKGCRFGETCEVKLSA